MAVRRNKPARTTTCRPRWEVRWRQRETMGNVPLHRSSGHAPLLTLTTTRLCDVSSNARAEGAAPVIHGQQHPQYCCKHQAEFDEA